MEKVSQEEIKVGLWDIDQLIVSIALVNEETTDVDLILRMVDRKISKDVESFMEMVPSINKVLFFTGDKGNWRKIYNQEQLYKGSRTEKLTWRKTIQQHIINKYGAISRPLMEADDLVTMAQHKMGYNKSVIIGLDKDFLQVKGWKLKPSIVHKGEVIKEMSLIYIDELESRLHFYAQLIYGDDQDDINNIKPIGKKRGKGKKGAYNLLENDKTEEEMFLTVLNQYKEAYSPLLAEYEIYSLIVERANLLYMPLYNGDKYTIPRTNLIMENAFKPNAL